MFRTATVPALIFAMRDTPLIACDLYRNDEPVERGSTRGCTPCRRSDTSAEFYDPATGKFTATGSMLHPRAGPTATLLGNPSLRDYGKVLIVGGNTTAGDLTAELYDPVTQTFSDALGAPPQLRKSSRLPRP